MTKKVETVGASLKKHNFTLNSYLIREYSKD